MLLPFKQLEKLGYLKLDNKTASAMANGTLTDESGLMQALSAKSVSFYMNFSGCPFMEPIAQALLTKCNIPEAAHWSAQEARKYLQGTDDSWYDKYHKVDMIRNLHRSAESDQSMWESYEFRYGVPKCALLELQEQLIAIIEAPGINHVALNCETYGHCLGVDLGSVPKAKLSPSWAPEGEMTVIEVDCGSYDASTNAITHNTNMAFQRYLFGNHYFIDALDSRKEAKLIGDNRFQTLKAIARYQMLSGHADTSFGNTVSNLTEMVASLFFSYPDLRETSKIQDDFHAWFRIAAVMTEGSEGGPTTHTPGTDSESNDESVTTAVSSPRSSQDSQRSRTSDTDDDLPPALRDHLEREALLREQREKKATMHGDGLMGKFKRYFKRKLTEPRIARVPTYDEALHILEDVVPANGRASEVTEIDLAHDMRAVVAESSVKRQRRRLKTNTIAQEMNVVDSTQVLNDLKGKRRKAPSTLVVPQALLDLHL